MIEKLLEVLELDDNYPELWQIKLIKFDTDLQQQKKSIEVFIASSSNIQDTKGNPGQNGIFYLTNFRIYWHLSIDKNSNLSIGFDSMTNVVIRSFPSQLTNSIKHMLIIKCQNQNQTRYQFRFTSFLDTDLEIFQRILFIQKSAQDTKFYRNIDTKLKQIDGKTNTLKDQVIVTRYNSANMKENINISPIYLIITNIRIIFIHKSGMGLNYGIPWTMISRLKNSDCQGFDSIKFSVRGILKHTQLQIYGKDQQFRKLRNQIYSFCKIYIKSPILGLNFQLQQFSSPQIQGEQKIQELQIAKVNIKRNKKVYAIQQQQGDLSKTQFNQELGIMMEKLPQGTTRSDLWEILRE